VSTQIDGAMTPFAEQLARLDTIRGVNKRTAEVLLAELGPDAVGLPPIGEGGPGRGASGRARGRWSRPR
jgi:transposase